MSGSVSERASVALDHMVVRAAKSTLAPSGADCQVTPIESVVSREKRVVMFTVSSYLFRALLFIHFDQDAGTLAHFAALEGIDSEEMSEERFFDAVMERGNLCCGTFNRELAHFFPHIGMSTPCILDRGSLDHVDVLKPAFSRHYLADLDAGVALHLTLAVCAFADLDFAYEAGAVEEESAGEMEMF